MITKNVACIAMLCILLTQSAQAAPGLSVTDMGVDVDNNQNWLVEVTPDSPPSSIAVELAFAIDDAELLDVDVNAAAWDHEGVGMNPFTGDYTFGLWLDLIGDRTFGAYGSIVFSSTDPVELFTIKTSADFPQTIRYGTAASGSPTLGARIAQHGTNYDGYTGSVTAVPEPASIVLAVAGLCAIAMAAARRRAA
jgi:hypothetical protein